MNLANKLTAKENIYRRYDDRLLEYENEVFGDMLPSGKFVLKCCYGKGGFMPLVYLKAIELECRVNIHGY